MEESLKKIGRFDRKRSEERLRSSFNPENCFVIYKIDSSNNEKICGFFQYEEEKEYINLQHLYIGLEFQGEGIGKIAINHIKEKSKDRGKKIKLFALKESRSNNFYLKNGFVKISEDDFDNIYVF